jgi:membrane fusion protein (multidrug efflux system)
MPHADRPQFTVADVDSNQAQGDTPQQSRGFWSEHPMAKWILLAVLAILVVAGYFVYKYYSARETTDDAQVDGYIIPISAKVGGIVQAVYFEDNQHVKAGTVLVQIDPRDYEAALQRAEAEEAAAEAQLRQAQTGVPITSKTTESRLATAQAGVRSANAQVAAAEREVAAAKAQLNSAQARLKEAEARNVLAQQNLKRMAALVAKDEISRQQYDTAVAEASSAQAAVEAAQAAVAQAEQAVQVAESHVLQAQAGVAQARAAVQAAETAPEQVASSEAQAGAAEARLRQARANLAQAKLNLSYTTVTAPADGIVSKKSVQPGQIVAAGQPLLSLVPFEEIWVTANFKETQLNHMRVGQAAIIKVDAFGGREFRGRVESFAPATGARFSLLPPENASGNFVKVVQRIPVRIAFDNLAEARELLRPGMSVVATVVTGD